MFKPTTYRGNNFNSFRIMLHLQQTRLCLLFLFKTPSKSQHASYRPEVFLYSRCEYCCTFSVGVIFYQQVEGWVLFFSRENGVLLLGTWVGSFSCSITMEFSLLDPVLPRPQNSHLYHMDSCTYFHLNEMQRSAEMHLLLTFILLSLQKENALKCITVLKFWVRWELLPFPSTSVWIEL